MPDHDEEKRACLKAMRLLERMDRTEKELREKLSWDGFSGEAVQNALEYVKSFGYVNDLRYAQNYISRNIGSKGRQRILQELYQRGVDSQTASEAWEEAEETQETDEEEIIFRVIQKKYPGKTSLDEKEARRLYGFLARRGFSSGGIIQAVRKLGVEKY